jgi:hypothetical protein
MSFTRCEHYDKTMARDHYIHYLDDSYDIEYLDAYFNEDFEEIDRIEESAFALGYGPRAKCTTITNSSGQKVHCRQSPL